MSKFIAFLIGAVVALLPVWLIQFHPMLGVVGNIVSLVFAAALHPDHLRKDEPAIILAMVLFSIVCQLAWAIMA